MISNKTTPQDIFIEGWGRMGGYWGISKVMAEIYAQLYLSDSPLTLEDMSQKLKTSRSNISLNVRGLIELGVVNKVVIRGERKDYYSAEDNIGKVAKLLAMAKKKRELDPAMEIVDEALAASRSMHPDNDDPQHQAFVDKLEELKRHMDFVNSIFLSFVGSEAAAKGDINGVEEIKGEATQETR
jgi:DNA-binding transcriptional regulator GbsR (MarR family)